MDERFGFCRNPLWGEILGRDEEEVSEPELYEELCSEAEEVQKEKEEWELFSQSS